MTLLYSIGWSLCCLFYFSFLCSKFLELPLMTRTYTGCYARILLGEERSIFRYQRKHLEWHLQAQKVSPRKRKPSLYKILCFSDKTTLSRNRYIPIFMSLLSLMWTEQGDVHGLVKHSGFSFPCSCKKTHICTPCQWFQVLRSMSIKFLFLEAENYICREQTHISMKKGERILRQWRFTRWAYESFESQI